MYRQQSDVIMKIYVIASLIFGLLSGGSWAASDDTNSTTTDSANTTTVLSTLPTESTSGNLTSTQPPPTTPLPTPGPCTDPKIGKWVVHNSENRTCIRLDAAIQFKFTYEQTNGKFVDTCLNVPTNASHNESSCERNILTLEFGGNSFSLNFVDEGKVFAKQAMLNYTVSEDVFPGAMNLGRSFPESSHNLTLFRVPKGKSYLCKEASKIDFTPNITGYLTNIQVEAFKNSTNEDFSSADECSSDKISDIVPIAVGCALAALVIIVLIAYLVGRQRTRQRGYQSV